MILITMCVSKRRSLDIKTFVAAVVDLIPRVLLPFLHLELSEHHGFSNTELLPYQIGKYVQIPRRVHAADGEPVDAEVARVPQQVPVEPRRGPVAGEALKVEAARGVVEEHEAGAARQDSSMATGERARRM